MAHKQEALLVRGPDRDLPVFLVRMIRVWIGNRERVEENGSRLLESNLVAAQVGFGLPWIPLEDHAGRLPYRSREAERPVRQRPRVARSVCTHVLATVAPFVPITRLLTVVRHCNDEDVVTPFTIDEAIGKPHHDPPPIIAAERCARSWVR